ncbi:hypothetical protein AB1Y20_008082 [Prymnesium parvum]|uniref:Uncharacterized protein n=1 Tax=Prymnesium parvum TaxID=97485 RepID=A0AB34IVN6_PRYPA
MGAPHEVAGPCSFPNMQRPRPPPAHEGSIHEERKAALSMVKTCEPAMGPRRLEERMTAPRVWATAHESAQKRLRLIESPTASTVRPERRRSAREAFHPSPQL